MPSPHFRLRPLLLALCLAAALPVAQADEPALTYVVAPQQTLIGLSRDVLTTPSAWAEVARINRLQDPNRITPGQTLRLPLRLLRSAQQAAKLISTEGVVTIDGQPAQPGALLTPPQSLRTGPSSSAVLQLGDGSRVKLTPLTDTTLDEHRRYDLRGQAQDRAGNDEGLFASTLRLLRGSLEVLATQVQRAKPLEVSTPTAVIGVRGTDYRVRHSDAGSGTEVLSGRVRADAGQAGADVPAGFGAALQANQKPQVTALLAAPDLSQLPQRFERPVVRFRVPSPEALRVQVAGDAKFERLVRDEAVPAGSEVRLTGLDDGPWHLRVRRVDAAGIEGFDASRSITLKARPEPPAAMAPRPAGKVAAGTVRFAWAENTEAASYRLEIAKDASFQPIVRAVDGVSGATTDLSLEEPGTYHWRLGSVRAGGDQGPWGDAQTLQVRALPEPPQGGLSGDGQSLSLAWSARAEDRQQVQLARDAGFTQLLNEASLSEARWQLPRPEQPGTVYFRYRAVEPDGFVSPWSSALKIEVPRDWRDTPWLLLPLLFAL